MDDDSVPDPVSVIAIEEVTTSEDFTTNGGPDYSRPDSLFFSGDLDPVSRFTDHVATGNSSYIRIPGEEIFLDHCYARPVPDTGIPPPKLKRANPVPAKMSKAQAEQARAIQQILHEKAMEMNPGFTVESVEILKHEKPPRAPARSVGRMNTLVAVPPTLPFGSSSSSSSDSPPRYPSLDNETEAAVALAALNDDPFNPILPSTSARSRLNVTQQPKRPAKQKSSRFPAGKKLIKGSPRISTSPHSVPIFAPTSPDFFTSPPGSDTFPSPGPPFSAHLDFSTNSSLSAVIAATERLSQHRQENGGASPSDVPPATYVPVTNRISSVRTTGRNESSSSSLDDSGSESTVGGKRRRISIPPFGRNSDFIVEGLVKRRRKNSSLKTESQMSPPPVSEESKAHGTTSVPEEVKAARAVTDVDGLQRIWSRGLDLEEMVDPHEITASSGRRAKAPETMDDVKETGTKEALAKSVILQRKRQKNQTPRIKEKLVKKQGKSNLKKPTPTKRKRSPSPVAATQTKGKDSTTPASKRTKQDRETSMPAPTNTRKLTSRLKQKLSNASRSGSNLLVKMNFRRVSGSDLSSEKDNAANRRKEKEQRKRGAATSKSVPPPPQTKGKQQMSAATKKEKGPSGKNRQGKSPSSSKTKIELSPPSSRPTSSSTRRTTDRKEDSGATPTPLAGETNQSSLQKGKNGELSAEEKYFNKHFNSISLENIVGSKRRSTSIDLKANSSATGSNKR
ncbi:unnamed protein product [Cyprideis torosa]|uniref:Uncharacterized protein n=1 Tax=Cyprideis torosa TaxID=163714 RepID=A0A7R8ZP06_9CRUS|nr:unnamed protein product [Cyprideis torosa]CAG0887546.1 unnamed protein product [Cyprideis torosa]